MYAHVRTVIYKYNFYCTHIFSLSFWKFFEYDLPFQWYADMSMQNGKFCRCFVERCALPVTYTHDMRRFVYLFKYWPHVAVPCPPVQFFNFLRFLRFVRWRSKSIYSRFPHTLVNVNENGILLNFFHQIALYKFKRRSYISLCFSRPSSHT